MSDHPTSVLDVGCGTGIAGRLFIARGCNVLGIEPDERMAEVARVRGLVVEERTFEAWESRGRTFDLLTCGAAWHWIDPVIGSKKAADTLRPGGSVALFWNRGQLDCDLHDELEVLYRKIVPGRDHYSALVRSYRDKRYDQISAAFAQTGAFGEVTSRSYPWKHRYGIEQWIAQLSTHNDHRLMEPSIRHELFSAIRRLIAQHGGFVSLDYECLLLVAQRTQ